MSRCRLTRAIAPALATMLWLAPASADDTGEANPPTAEAKQQASKAFRAGVAAYKNHSYADAAENFEKAYSLAPHPTALWNAADAREKAGETVRAANMYVRYLEVSSEGDKDRVEARARLSQLTARLGRIEITSAGARDLTVDEEHVGQNPLFVDPGDHTVSGRIGGQKVTRRVSVVAGSKIRVVLSPEAGSSAPKEEDKTAASTDDKSQDKDQDKDKGKEKDTSKSKSGLGPEFFYIGAGVSTVLLGVTIWSGLNTQSLKSDFDANKTHAGYVDGMSAQKRTNVLIGVTAAVAVTTAALGLFVVRWDDGSEAKVSVSPNGASFHLNF